MMRISSNEILKAISICIIALLSFQELSAGENEQVLHSQRTDYIKIVDQDNHSIPNDHPFPVSREEIVSVLGHLNYTKKSFFGIGGSDAHSVFTGKQLQELSQYLVKGLSTANSREDVVFAVSGLKSHLLADKPLVTSARVFVSSGKLNIIFGEIDMDFQAQIDKLDHHAYVERLKAGDRSARAKQLSDEAIHNYPIKPGLRKEEGYLEGVQISTDSQLSAHLKRSDWIVINLQPRTQEAYDEFARIKQANDHVDRIRARHEGKFSAAPQHDITQNSQAHPTRHSYTQTLTIEQRLRKLKELRAKELIDETTYQRKLEEIVDEL